jgi:hypothetical protein
VCLSSVFGGLVVSNVGLLIALSEPALVPEAV